MRTSTLVKAQIKLSKFLVQMENTLKQSVLKGMVQERTDRYQDDLTAINNMLEQVPDSQNKDTAWLEQEITNVLIQVLKEKLPEYESQLEWEEE